MGFGRLHHTTYMVQIPIVALHVHYKNNACLELFSGKKSTNNKILTVLLTYHYKKENCAQMSLLLQSQAGTSNEVI
jgi:hypothetical protein